ncbi:MAG: hypothetical protein KBB61_06035 [Paludibacteraceae bacterium]|jgi:heme/copper-type cytochrome/quinol oxidase subunit 4|nr:hypothetical protein [Paludibacteraceae bacterium]MDI9536717.1 hypothetical protein [Bacteroidota bacterium]HHT61080.1 hypothetical protein [Bacteroidales bacterium]MBP9039595.1 hypothetical protein [Paludibacteraceae bacterium]HOA46930.1 hypothetical protein [Paludibacteraceae bacterium]
MNVNKFRLLNILFIISHLLVIGGAVCYLSDFRGMYIFGAGAVILTIVRFLSTPPSSDFRIQRLNRMQAISTILLLATIYLMYKEFTSWGLTLTIAAIIDLVIAFRKPS